MTQKEEKMEEGRAESKDAINSSGSGRIWAMKERIKTRLKGIDLEYVILLALAITLVTIGTVLFHVMERWSWIDSFYFTVITLTTIGYGDLTPDTPTAKLVTVFFAISGVGIFLGFLNKVMQRRVERSKGRLKKR